MDDLILSTASNPQHRKRRSTFGDIPYANTNGLDDFFGFNATETKYLAEIKELNQMLSESTELVDEKQSIIKHLRLRIQNYQSQYESYERQLNQTHKTIEKLQSQNAQLLHLINNHTIGDMNNASPLENYNELLEDVPETNISLHQSHSERSLPVKNNKTKANVNGRNTSKKLIKFNTFSAGTSARTSPTATYKTFFVPGHKRNSSKSDFLAASILKRATVHSGSAFLSKPGINNPKSNNNLDIENLPNLVLPPNTISVVSSDGRHSMSASLSAFIEQVSVKFHDTPKNISTDAELEVILANTDSNVTDSYPPMVKQSSSSTENIEPVVNENARVLASNVSDMDFVAVNSASFFPLRRSSLSDVECDTKESKNVNESTVEARDSLQSNVNNFFVQEMNINTVNQSDNSVNNVVTISDIVGDGVGGGAGNKNFDEQYLKMINYLNEEISDMKSIIKRMVESKNILAERTAVEIQQMRYFIQCLLKCQNL